MACDSIIFRRVYLGISPLPHQALATENERSGM
jgi:hypothetical protein